MEGRQCSVESFVWRKHQGWSDGAQEDSHHQRFLEFGTAPDQVLKLGFRQVSEIRKLFLKPGLGQLVDLGHRARQVSVPEQRGDWLVDERRRHVGGCRVSGRSAADPGCQSGYSHRVGQGGGLLGRHAPRLDRTRGPQP